MNLPINLKVCETFCNEKQVFPAMRYFVEDKGLNPTAAGKEVEKITKGQVTAKRATRVYQSRKPLKKTAQTGQPNKPTKKHTKPEVKKQLKTVAKLIITDQVSNEDIIATVGKAINQGIRTGKLPKRVGASIAAAVGSKPKKKGGENKKPIDNFYRLNHHFKVVMDGLTIWADGAMMPTTKDEIACAQAMLLKAPNFIIQMHRLGVDIEGLFETLVREKPNEKNEQNQIQFKPG